MLTVADVLTLDVMHGAQVVAGRGGLHRVVNWVHNAGVPDAAQWLNGGELVLTTIINMPPDEDGQRRYLQAMIDKGVAGLILTTGKLIQHAPEYLLPLADAHDFPLIEISYTVRFVDIAQTVIERITEENLAPFRRALEIHQALTRIVLQGGSLTQLAETMAALIKQSISIEDAQFRRLASVNIAPVDEARRYTQQYGRTAPHLVEALESEVMPEIRRTLRPVFIPQMPQVGLEMERILAPIVVHGEIYGYVWLIADDRPLSELDYMAIESGTTIAALMMLYQESIQNAEASLKGGLLTRLIQGEMSNAAVMADQALRYGVDLRGKFRLLVVAHPAATTRDLLDLFRRLNTQEAIVGQFAGQVILLAQADKAESLAQHIIQTEPLVRVGISAEHSSAAKVMQAYTQCGEALDITGKLRQTARIVHFDGLGYLHALYHAGPAALQDNPYTPALRLLLDEKQADLFNTLEAYLDAGGNGMGTAEGLHIHRSTLIYRLQRIAEICKADLSDPVTRMNLQVALKLMRLFGL